MSVLEIRDLAVEIAGLPILEDLSLVEIGDVLGVPVGTVKSRLFKARRELRSVLEREQGKDVQHA